jgi:hypothetical protein
MVRIKDTSSFGMLTAQNAKRKAIMQQGMVRSNAMRTFQSAHINKNASMTVQTTEMQLRANAQAAAKAKLANLTALQNKVNKTV